MIAVRHRLSFSGRRKRASPAYVLKNTTLTRMDI